MSFFITSLIDPASSSLPAEENCLWYPFRWNWYWKRSTEACFLYLIVSSAAIIFRRPLKPNSYSKLHKLIPVEYEIFHSSTLLINSNAIWVYREIPFVYAIKIYPHHPEKGDFLHVFKLNSSCEDVYRFFCHLQMRLLYQKDQFQGILANNELMMKETHELEMESLSKSSSCPKPTYFIYIRIEKNLYKQWIFRKGWIWR